MESLGREEHASKDGLELKEDQRQVNSFRNGGVIAIRHLGIKGLAQEGRDGEDQKRVNAGSLSSARIRNTQRRRRPCDTAHDFTLAC